MDEAATGQFPNVLPTTTEVSADAKKGADAAGQLPLAIGLGAAGAVLGLVALAVEPGRSPTAGLSRPMRSLPDPARPADRPRGVRRSPWSAGSSSPCPRCRARWGAVVAAHSQLVSSIPGAGEAVDTPPTELRLQFSESIAAGYTSFDLLDGTGKTLLLTAGIGRPDRRPPASSAPCRRSGPTPTPSTGGRCPPPTGT